MNDQNYQAEVDHEDSGSGHTFSGGQEDSVPIYDVQNENKSSGNPIEIKDIAELKTQFSALISRNSDLEGMVFQCMEL